MTDPTSAPARAWTIAVDARDVLLVLGFALILVGAAAIHWALAIVIVGLAFVALAYRLTRKAP